MRTLVVLARHLRDRGRRAGPQERQPEDRLPADVTQLTAFGERASWSPDGQRVAFMSKSFGDACWSVEDEGDPAADAVSESGVLRVQYLPNGDYLLIGARTFTDVQTTRARDARESG